MPNPKEDKSLEDIFEEFVATQKKPEPCFGGVIIPKSDCCHASIDRTEGGVIIEYCSCCGGSPHMIIGSDLYGAR